MIKFEKPTEDMVQFIADNMRQADIDEVWASSNSSPLKAIMRGWDLSHCSTIVTVNGVPCVMIGLVVSDPLSGIGVPWLLGTNGAMKHRREFLKLSPPVIQEMLNICPVLYNYVHAKNKLSVDWLRWLGFTIDEPQPYGLANEMFHKFHMEKVTDV